MKRIMAVDDSNTMLKIISSTLRYEGFDVVTANSAEKALSILADENKFNVIITDINMAEMDGIALTSEIRSIGKYKYTPIIIVSTESSGDKREAGKKAGATGWIVKPFVPDQLVSVVRKVSP